MTQWLVFFVLPLVASLLLSRLVIHHLGKRLLDTPNTRSSHQTPTPRGGGIAILISTITSVIIAVTAGYLGGEVFCWLIIPASLISLIGIYDDFFNLSVRLRLSIQFILATFAIYFLSQQHWQPHTLLEFLPVTLMILFIVWMTNLYNFMDGINGLAALQSISVCLGMILIYTFQNTHQPSIYLMLVIMASSCGFLFWNFPTAKLFMGDSGSLFLGFSFGLLALEPLHENYNLTAAWIIMLGVFIVDASYTLFYRIVSKQAFLQAHRSHTYQKGSRISNSHTMITLIIIAINILWLFPLAMATAGNILNPFTAVLLAYTPLIFIAKKYNAGHPD